MFTIIGIQLEYQSTYVIKFYCWSYTLNKKTRDKKKCLFDVQIITKIDTWYDYDIRMY
jgi:hypothetical protein